MKDNRRESTKKKYPLTTVVYNCPGCGVEATSTATQEFNDLWLKNIKGNFCPDCEAKRKRVLDMPLHAGETSIESNTPRTTKYGALTRYTLCGV